MIPDYPFITDGYIPENIPDYLMHDPFDSMTDEELQDYFLDSEADRAIEEEKSNPSNYYYEP